ncbi:hypothetical protein JW960_24585 [candidate division KSB1 bacterium]|nr:hypothetical protein [candidate division KSB1 bacterium]
MFEHLTLEDGLSQGTVLSIVQDRFGFMWFGTLDGLNRYDGYSFTVYKNSEADPTTISDDWITALYIDRNNTLWIGTLEGGLNMYNMKCDNFRRFPLEFYYNTSRNTEKFESNIPFSFSYLNDRSISAIFEDSKGILWIGTFGNGIFCFNRNDETFSHFPYNFQDRNNQTYNIQSITETLDQSNNRTMWFGTFGGGLLKYNEETGFRIFSHKSDNPAGLIHNQINFLYPDTSCNKTILWIATLGGLDCMDIETENFSHFYSNPADPNSLFDNRVLSILKDKCDALWIATYDGLDRLDLATKTFSHYRHRPANSYSINSNQVFSLYHDRSNVIWVGTDFGNGVNKFDNSQQQFMCYRKDITNKNSLSDNVILSILRDSRGHLWLGTIQGGVTEIDRQTNTYIQYLHNPATQNSIADNHVRAIYEDRSGILWFGTLSGGLDAYNRETRTFQHYQHDPHDPKSLSARQVRTIHEDREGILWIGTFGGGLNKFDRVTETFTHFRHDPDIINSPGEDRIYCIAEDDSGYLWIATFDGGFDRFDKTNSTFIHYKHDPHNVNSLSDNRVMSIRVDPYRAHTLWLGTFGGGLNRFDMKSKSFIRYTMAEGLPNNVVYGILFDKTGALWLSTNNGIAHFNSETMTFINYGVADGIQGTEFNAGAYYQCSSTGEMFFGGINGFNSFFPDMLHTDHTAPDILLTSFKIFGEETLLDDGPIWQCPHVNLSYKEKVLTFEFSVVDYAFSAKNQYAYQLSGLHDDWIRCGTHRSATFTNLDPGDYTLRVKGCNSDGVWNEQGTMLMLTIHPPFWETFWFYTICIATIAMTIIFLYRQRLRINIERRLEMERIRIAENEQVRRTLAADFHDELGQKLTRISLFSEILRRKLISDHHNDLEYVDKINRAAKELALSTRDFIWTINPSQDSLYDVALYIKDSGDELFDQTGIDFRVNGISKSFEDLKLPMTWRRHVILIFKEAMHNALKHANCRTVTFSVAFAHNLIRIELADDGQGGANKPSTNGQGLHNIHNRAQTLGGTIIVQSSKSQGTTITFSGQIPQKGH